jgi:hypothetical protein
VLGRQSGAFVVQLIRAPLRFAHFSSKAEVFSYGAARQGANLHMRPIELMPQRQA